MDVAPGAARAAVRDFAASLDLPAAAVADVLICVSEVVTNVVQHAYRDAEEPGPVHIEAHLEDGDLCIAVRDHGQGMTPRTDSPGLGLGLPTISSLARSVDIRVHDRGTEVSMRFALAA